MKKLLFILLCLITGGCGPNKKLQLLDQTLEDYRTTIRWGLSERLEAFQNRHENAAPATDPFQEIRVTSYKPIKRTFVEGKEGDTVHQTVEIRYYHDQSGVEKTLIDKQLWHYDEKKERWRLQSDLPHF